MKQDCKFRQGADIIETQPGLQVNIPDSIDYHRIQDTSVPAMYNGQKELSDVGQRIREPFDVIEYDRAYTRIRHYHNMKDKKDNQSVVSKGDK